MVTLWVFWRAQDALPGGRQLSEDAPFYLLADVSLFLTFCTIGAAIAQLDDDGIAVFAELDGVGCVEEVISFSVRLVVIAVVFGFCDIEFQARMRQFGVTIEAHAVVSEPRRAFDVVLILIRPMQLNFFAAVGDGVGTLFVARECHEIAILVIATEEFIKLRKNLAC